MRDTFGTKLLFKQLGRHLSFPFWLGSGAENAVPNCGAVKVIANQLSNEVLQGKTILFQMQCSRGDTASFQMRGFLGKTCSFQMRCYLGITYTFSNAVLLGVTSHFKGGLVREGQFNFQKPQLCSVRIVNCAFKSL